VFVAGLLQSPSQPPPVIVKIVEPPSDPTGLADVLLGALGLTGVLILGALLLGLVTAGVLFLIHRRSA
jgi:hypothetical protein